MPRYSAPFTVKHFCPPSFSNHVYERSFKIKGCRDTVWRFLNTKETFTSGQPFPFRVEFVGSESECGFEQGVGCIHHGPLMLFSGEIGELRAPEYRDLQYYYGSHAISLRIIRPYRLEFWLDEDVVGETQVTLRVSSYVRNGFAWFWTGFQKMFWTTFPLACRVGLKSFS